MLALREYEAGVHDDCGLHDSVAMKDPNFTLDDRVCPVGSAIERHLRQRAAEEHEREKDLDPGLPRKGDGRSTTVRLLPG
jgi:hypothetical protein